MTTVIETPEGPLPIPLPFSGHPPPLPHIANPLPGLIDTADRKWETIAHGVSNLWHSGVSFLEGTASLALSDVETIVDTAINASQTAWSSMVSTLEAWTITGIDQLDTAIGNAVAIEYETGTVLEGLIAKTGADALRWVADAIAQAERYADVVRDGLTTVIENTADITKAWVLTDVALPLLREIERAKADVLDALERGLADVETYARDLTNPAALAAALGLAGILSRVVALEGWLSECGDPMCSLIGPGTQLAGLLGNAELLELLAMLLALKTLTDPQQVADAAVYVTDVLAPSLDRAIEAWVSPLLDAIPG